MKEPKNKVFSLWGDFKNICKGHHIKILLVVLVLIVAGGVFVYTSVFAVAGGNLSGYAWSSTTGWVSMSCNNNLSCGSTDNYGVTVEPPNGAGISELSGHAWSPNVGWISFEAGDVGSCPSGPGTCIATFDSNTGLVKGWARALSPMPPTPTSEHGDWDGWISLSCENLGTCPPVLGGIEYRVSATACDWGGMAWGGDSAKAKGVIGWLSFDGSLYHSGVIGTGDACVPPPNIDTLVYTDDPVPNGDSATITWTTSNATECYFDAADASIGLTGSYLPNDSAVTISLEEDESYTLTCSGPGGTVTYPTQNLNVLPGVVFNAPNNVIEGGSLTFSWEVKGTGVTCLAENHPTDTPIYNTATWSGLPSLSTSPSPPTHSTLVTGITGSGKFVINCSNAHGSPPTPPDPPITQYVNVNVPGVSLTASPQQVLRGRQTTIIWNAEYVTAPCTFKENGTTIPVISVYNGDPSYTDVGVYLTPIITSDTTYEISCPTPAGTIADTIIVSPFIPSYEIL